jgi:hypothetical protein
MLTENYSNAFWLSSVVINSISFAVMLEQTSLSIRAAIFGESPSVNPNCMFDWPSLAIVVFSSSIAIVDLYQGLTSTVKWNGDTSLSFSINQGVRQGGVLATHLYKQYLNELLNDLENHNIGISIGNTYAGCPTCAGDVRTLRSVLKQPYLGRVLL